MFGTRKHAGALSVPPDAAAAPDAHEVLRFWIAGRRGHVALHTGHGVQGVGSDDLGAFWGIMMADIAQHAVEAMHLEGGGTPSRDALMTRVTQVFLDELGFGRGVVGNIVETND